MRAETRTSSLIEGWGRAPRTTSGKALLARCPMAAGLHGAGARRNRHRRSRAAASGAAARREGLAGSGIQPSPGAGAAYFDIAVCTLTRSVASDCAALPMALYFAGSRPASLTAAAIADCFWSAAIDASS